MTTNTEAEGESRASPMLAQASLAGRNGLLSAELGAVWMSLYTCLAHYWFHRWTCW